MITTKPDITANSIATGTNWTVPVIICLMRSTAYVTGLSLATNASQDGNSSNGKSAGLSMNRGIPRKLMTPQKVSWDLDVAATITDIPEKPSEKIVTVNKIGNITSKFEMCTPNASAIPRIRLDCNAEIKDIASIFPNAIEDLDTGETRALFMKPYRLSHNVLTPPKILVNIAVSIITPGAMNSM